MTQVETSYARVPLEGPAVRTGVPGPSSRRYLERQEAYESNARSYPRRLPIAIERAAGPFVRDVDGNVYIDFLTGAGVLALGHNHPEVVDAVRRQLELHCHGLDFPTPIKDEFVSVQLGLLPPEMHGRTRIQFCGAAGENAIDAALKLCKTATGRGDVVAFHGGFHGSTHSTMAVSGLLAQKEPVANLVPGVHFFPYPYCYRCLLGLSPDTCATSCLTYLERVLTDPNGGVPRPAAVLVEPVQGEGGVIPAPPEFLQGLRRLTRELDVPLIVDEVQSGCGRTGKWFAFEHAGIVPDVVVASKALGGIGMPIAAIFYDERLDVWEPGAHTGTFRGNQLAFAAGAAAARIIVRDGILDHVRELGAYALERLAALPERHPFVGEVRGIGLMLGIELVDAETGAFDGQRAATVQRLALERGLIVELGGRDDCVVRLMPPLNVTTSVLDDGLAILEEALDLAA